MVIDSVTEISTWSLWKCYWSANSQNTFVIAASRRLSLAANELVEFSYLHAQIVWLVHVGLSKVRTLTQKMHEMCNVKKRSRNIRNIFRHLRGNDRCALQSHYLSTDTDPMPNCVIHSISLTATSWRAVSFVAHWRVSCKSEPFTGKWQFVWKRIFAQQHQMRSANDVTLRWQTTLCPMTCFSSWKLTGLCPGCWPIKRINDRAACRATSTASEASPFHGKWRQLNPFLRVTINPHISLIGRKIWIHLLGLLIVHRSRTNRAGSNSFRRRVWLDGPWGVCTVTVNVRQLFLFAAAASRGRHQLFDDWNYKGNRILLMFY